MKSTCLPLPSNARGSSKDLYSHVLTSNMCTEGRGKSTENTLEDHHISDVCFDKAGKLKKSCFEVRSGDLASDAASQLRCRQQLHRLPFVCERERREEKKRGVCALSNRPDACFESMYSFSKASFESGIRPDSEIMEGM